MSGNIIYDSNKNCFDFIEFLSKEEYVIYETETMALCLYEISQSGGAFLFEQKQQYRGELRSIRYFSFCKATRASMCVAAGSTLEGCDLIEFFSETKQWEPF